MKPVKRVLSCLLLLVAAPASAETLDLSLGENSARAALLGPLASLFGGIKGDYDVGLLVRPKTDEDYLQLHAGAMITGDAGARYFDAAAGLGARLLYIGADDDSGGAVALGGQFEARLPELDRVGFTGQAWYAPSATTFGEMDEYLELGGAIEYQVIRDSDAFIYLGYRNINISTEEADDITVESGLRFGLRLVF